MEEKPFGLAVKALVNDAAGNCLLLRRSMESRHYAGKWDLPGGKVDEGESFDVGLLREVKEESGLNVSIDGVAGAIEYEMSSVRVVLLFLEASLTSGEVTLSEEHDKYEWVPRDKVPDMDLSEQLAGFLRRTNS